jgi:hypothetical protein
MLLHLLDNSTAMPVAIRPSRTCATSFSAGSAETAPLRPATAAQIANAIAGVFFMGQVFLFDTGTSPFLG